MLHCYILTMYEIIQCYNITLLHCYNVTQYHNNTVTQNSKKQKALVLVLIDVLFSPMSAPGRVSTGDGRHKSSSARWAQTAHEPKNICAKRFASLQNLSYLRICFNDKVYFPPGKINLRPLSRPSGHLAFHSLCSRKGVESPTHVVLSRG